MAIDALPQASRLCVTIGARHSSHCFRSRRKWLKKQIMHYEYVRELVFVSQPTLFYITDGVAPRTRRLRFRVTQVSYAAFEWCDSLRLFSFMKASSGRFSSESRDDVFGCRFLRWDETRCLRWRRLLRFGLGI